MTEEEFDTLIDCRFPYDDYAEAQRLLRLGCSISANAAFCVVHELARVPASVKVAPETLLGLLDEVGSYLEHPLADRVLEVAARLVRKEPLSQDEALSLMREVAAYPNQYHALSVVYFAEEEASNEVDELYKEIVEQWRQSA